jgi:uncharacterized protein (TIGR03067 family)
MLRFLSLLLALPGLAFAPAPLPRHGGGNEAEVKGLQGAWLLVSEVSEGVKTGEVAAKFEWVIEGRNVRNLVRGHELFSTTFRIHAGRPPALDLMERDGSVAARGVYALEGDKLTIAFALDGGARPGDFLPSEGKVVRVYRREKR